MLRVESLEVSSLAEKSILTEPFTDFTDNHMHIDPINGEGVDAVKKFERAGGRFIFLVCKTTTSWNFKSNLGGFEKLFDATMELSEEINENTGVTAFPVLGVHPAEFAGMCESSSVTKALDVAKAAIDAAGSRIGDGKAVAIGEVGRPHFEVSQEVLDASNELMTYAFEIASDIDCAVQLHTESVGDEQLREFGALAASVGLDPKRVIKHYSPPLIPEAEEAGIFPSLIASEDNIKNAIQQGSRFLMESDYIDELERPGAVMGPKSVPRVSLKLMSEGFLTEEDLIKIHRDNVEEAYGISLF
jgi:TatD-related deoxyribonuclease